MIGKQRIHGAVSIEPFSKAESRYEREKRIKVGNVDDYRCGQSSSTYDPERDRFEPPPNVSSAQKNYEKDRFKVQPGSIKSYSLGRGSIATHERQKVRYFGRSMQHFNNVNTF